MHLHAVGYIQKPEDTSDHRDRVYLYFIRKDEASRVCVSSPRNLRSLQKVESVANHAAEETELSLIYDYKFCCRLGSANTIRRSSFFPLCPLTSTPRVFLITAMNVRSTMT